MRQTGSLGRTVLPLAGSCSTQFRGVLDTVNRVLATPAGSRAAGWKVAQYWLCAMNQMMLRCHSFHSDADVDSDWILPPLSRVNRSSQQGGII